MTAALSVVRPGASEHEASLDLRDVSCRYGGTGFLSRRARSPIVVDAVSLQLAAGETLALVGESGSGKSTLAKAIAGLHPTAAGHISFTGTDVTRSVERRTVDLRRRIQIVFQNPDASLNRRHRIGTILARPLKLFFKLSRARRREAVAELLAAVQLPAEYAVRFPSEISGGERQRVAIARALAAEPELLLCDEVVSALDVSVQATILDLLQSIQRRNRLSILFITHDLAAVRWFANRVAVLYRGQLCEVASAEDLFAGALHPYTRTLLDAVPRFGHRASPEDVGPEDVELEEAGQVAGIAGKPAAGGCAFVDRCPHAIAGLCHEVRPPWHITGGGDHQVRCHLGPTALSH